MRSPQDLVGRLLAVHTASARPRNRAHAGRFFIARVERVELAGRGNARHLGRLTVRLFNASSRRYDGSRLKIEAAEYSAAICGVEWRRKIVPVAAWLAG